MVQLVKKHAWIYYTDLLYSSLYTIKYINYYKPKRSKVVTVLGFFIIQFGVGLDQIGFESPVVGRDHTLLIGSSRSEEEPCHLRMSHYGHEEFHCHFSDVYITFWHPYFLFHSRRLRLTLFFTKRWHFITNYLFCNKTKKIRLTTFFCTLNNYWFDSVIYYWMLQPNIWFWRFLSNCDLFVLIIVAHYLLFTFRHHELPGAHVKSVADDF